MKDTAELRNIKSVQKWVYLFSEGNANMRELLGGKGAGVAEMTNAGLPVPPGFIIATEACNAYYEAGKQYPQGMWEQTLAALKIVEQQTSKHFGQKDNPLLVSVRSGGKFSMPGMMDTVLNLGINDETVQGLVALTGDERFAYDAYRRFIQMFSKIVLDTDPRDFEHILDQYKERAGVQTDAEIPAADLKKLVVDFKQIAERQTSEPFPTNVYQQLHKAIEAVFSSWNNRRALDYRNFNKIPHSLGTAVNVQSMVFGNLGNDSGTGVAFTRNPGTGEKKLYGEYLLNAQGEDVVAGIRTPSKISRLQEDLPQVHQQLLELSQQLEYHYRDVQDFEFTIEHGKIWLLQSRLAKRSARANLRNAIDLLDEGRISVEEAIFRVKPTDLEQILAPRLPSGMNIQPLARGLNASPGIVHGEAIFDAETADELATAGKKVILIVPDTSPDDIHGVTTSQGVVTSRGSATSHAAVACRSLNKPCVAGANIRINALEKHFTVLSKVVKEGDQLTIDGASGVIYEGIIPLVEVNVQDNPYLIRYMGLFESINTDDYVEDGAGILWLLRDTLKNKSIPSFITGSIPLIPESFELATEYISFRQPPQSIISNILSSLQSQIDPDTIAAIWGILRVLGSMLQNEIGIGNHYLAIRPLIDPLRAWIDLNSKSITSDGLVISKPPIQLVGIEFFGINRFLRHYLPWSDIQWWSLIRLSHAEINYIWRLDNSNPRGESLVPGLGELIGFLVLLNGRCLTLLETKAFYNDLRKRAFGWNWYQEHNTSWREVIDTLQRYWHGSHVDKEVLAKYQDIGLLTKEWQLSPVGVALLLEQTAVQRRNITFAGRKLLDE